MKPTDLDTSKSPSKIFKCWKCLVSFYLILFCISAVSIGIFASFLLIFRPETHQISPKVLLYFLIVPTIFAVFSTVVGWSSIRSKNIVIVKLFAVLLAATVLVEIGGSLWCLASVHKTQEEVVLSLSEKFSQISSDGSIENFWNVVQRKFKCCGMYGPSDYHSKQAFPFSCCGSSNGNETQGSCNLIWQKGCSEAVSSKLTQDLIAVGLMSLVIAFLQIPGVFISWCFANRISRDAI